MSAREPFSAERRRALLREMYQLRGEMQRLEVEYEDAEGAQEEALGQRADYIWDTLPALRAKYEDGLPRVPLSRCPFCEAVLVRPFDSFGLDGLWWDHYSPVRPVDSEPCPHVLALSGAVRLAKPIEEAPILVKTGPEPPYVLPRVLQGQPVKVVISSIAIGRHAGYPITYFIDGELPADVDSVAEWGTNRRALPGGGFTRDEIYDVEEDFDFDLAPWIQGGQVLWIAAGDEELALRSEVQGCPYLDLPGRREIVRVQDGKAWSPSGELE